MNPDQEFGEMKAKIDILTVTVKEGFDQLKADYTSGFQQIKAEHTSLRVDHEARLRNVEAWKDRLDALTRSVIKLGAVALSVAAIIYH